MHHRWYEKNKDPWEYPDECLVTLCEECHEEETQSTPLVCDSLALAVKQHFLSSDITNIAIGFYYMPLIHTPEVQASALSWFLQSDKRMRMLVEMYFQDLTARHEAQTQDNADAKKAAKVCKS